MFASTLFASLALFAAMAPENGAASSTGIQELAKQAIHVILSQQMLNTLNPEPKTGKPLATNGKWQAGNQRPAACPNTTESCIQVYYRVPEVSVSCEWVVLLLGDGTQGKILERNEDAAKYFVQNISPQDLKGSVLKSVRAVYSPIARAAHVAGDVRMKVTVDASGDVTDASVISGPEMLRAASIDAVKQFKYKPLMVGDKAAPFLTVVTMRYQIGSPTGVYIP
jgi:TonB family protein